MAEELNIAQYIQQGIGQPRKLTLDLSIALANQRFAISGTQFGIWASPLSTDEIQVRFNANQAVEIPFQRGRVLAVPFNKVFITVPGTAAGNMDIIYGHGAMDLFRIFPAIPEPFTAMETILNSMNRELEGDLLAESFNAVAVGVAAVQIMPANVDRVGCSVQARWDNTGIIYVGFDNGVGPAAYQSCLAAGESYSWDDYRGPIFAEASVAAQEVGYGEW